ncbi:MAG: hypothetical protein ACOYXT_24025 [Bacteroidota bacterium]
MNRSFFKLILIFFLSSTFDASAQKKSANEKPLTPARGHYVELQKFSVKSRLENASWDEQKFPYDAEQAARRLSLMPYYLENVSADVFKIPDPPANSSAQTRAELNYLLQLQLQRNKIDTDASLLMGAVFYSPRAKPTDEGYQQLRQNLFFIGPIHRHMV